MASHGKEGWSLIAMFLPYCNLQVHAQNDTQKSLSPHQYVPGLKVQEVLRHPIMQFTFNTTLC